MQKRTTTIVIGIAVAAAAVGAGVGYYYYLIEVQEAHFQDCKNRLLDVSNRMSQLMDRAKSIIDFGGEIRAEASANMNEFIRLEAECSDVSERINQDHAVRARLDYVGQQMRNYGIIQ